MFLNLNKCMNLGTLQGRKSVYNHVASLSYLSSCRKFPGGSGSCWWGLIMLLWAPPCILPSRTIFFSGLQCLHSEEICFSNRFLEPKQARGVRFWSWKGPSETLRSQPQGILISFTVRPWPETFGLCSAPSCQISSFSSSFPHPNLFKKQTPLPLNDNFTVSIASALWSLISNKFWMGDSQGPVSIHLSKFGSRLPLWSFLEPPDLELNSAEIIKTTYGFSWAESDTAHPSKNSQTTRARKKGRTREYVWALPVLSALGETACSRTTKLDGQGSHGTLDSSFPRNRFCGLRNLEKISRCIGLLATHRISVCCQVHW